MWTPWRHWIIQNWTLRCSMSCSLDTSLPSIPLASASSPECINLGGQSLPWNLPPPSGKSYRSWLPTIHRLSHPIHHPAQDGTGSCGLHRCRARTSQSRGSKGPGETPRHWLPPERTWNSANDPGQRRLHQKSTDELSFGNLFPVPLNWKPLTFFWVVKPVRSW